jgi:hypothetical protein
MIRRINALDPLRRAEEQLPPINKAIVAFERRLHERLFGTLDGNA